MKDELVENLTKFLKKHNVVKQEIKIPYNEENMRIQRMNQTVDVLAITMELTIRYIEENYIIMKKGK